MTGGFLACLAGCSDHPSDKTRATGPGPQAEALYGQPRDGEPAPKRARPGIAWESAWTNAPFWFLQTELSPATLYHSTTKYLGLFTQMGGDGLGAPGWVSFSTRQGPRSFPSGAAFDPTGMEENWVVVWFYGARGWTNWDSPWAVFLQHRPASMKLDDEGLHFTFAGPAGDVAVMPLYGYEKLPLTTNDYRAAHGLPGWKTRTQTWTNALPREPLMRVRYWAGATREMPVQCEESFSVDRARDSVTLRQRFEWRSIDDDWGTKHLKLAPVSPPLAQASKDKSFPARFSTPPMDYEYGTPYGPYIGVEGADMFDATLAVLSYVNETEAADAPNTNAHPSVALAWRKLNQLAGEKFQRADPFAVARGGGDAFRQAVREAGLDAKALRYLDAPVRTNAQASLRNFFSEGVLTPARCTTNGAGDYAGDVIEALWAYAHFTGDWELVRARWPLVRPLWDAPASPRWAGGGRDGVVAFSGEASWCAAFARLAYQAGDMDGYHEGCARFARELVRLHLKWRGADYFRRRQPWHSMEFMDEQVFLTHVRDEAGWQLDGPNYPAAAGERQFQQRWARFQDLDMARFHREFHPDDARRELHWLQSRWEPRQKGDNDPHALPSLLQLRSWLLHETPAQLAAVATPDMFTGPASGQLANCLAVLRASRPTRYVRLIPGAAASAFAPAFEREASGDSFGLAQSVQHETPDSAAGSNQTIWPRATWGEWRTPTGARWNFGHVRPVRSGPPARANVTRLNANTRIVSYPELP